MTNIGFSGVPLVWCFVASSAWAWFQADQPARRAPFVEMTEADLLLNRDWDATRVQVAGLHLGMPRDQAKAALQRRGFHLMQLTQYGAQSGWTACSGDPSCFVAGSRSDTYEGVTVTFSGVDQVEKIDIEVDLEARSRLQSHFVGETRQFFGGHYSEALRLRLFGPQTARETVSGRYGEKFASSGEFVGDLGPNERTDVRRGPY